MERMKALVKAEAAPGLWLQDVPRPEPGPNDVLIRIHKTAICGTDVHIYNWDEWARQTIEVPMHIGHEFVGVVEGMGGEVTGIEVGDLVSGEGHIVCGRCRNCQAGQRHLCINTKGVGVNRPGAFAEYLSIPAANVWICNPRIPKDVLACLDPLGNATHAALSFDLVGEDVLITGAGPIGCMSAAIARHVGARFVVVTDVNPYRLKLAEQMGATLAVDVRETSIAEAQERLGMREGFDVGLEMSGTPDGLRSMLENVRTGANIALLGILPEKTAIDWDAVVFKGLTIKGIYGREMFETWYKMTAMLQNHLDISPIITHRLPYTEFERAFEAINSGHSGKVVLSWVDQPA
jgi:threonine 3-dehydrogenase